MQVLNGVPTYHDNSLRFHDGAENLPNGVAGITAGLNSVPQNGPFTGVAIYRFALTTDADWDAYGRLWLGSRRVSGQ